MSVLALLVLLQASPAVSPPRPDTGGDVVVMARSAGAARAALERCIAERCPPDREMRAAMALAQEEFLAGDYTGSRRTLLASKRRNARHAGTYPMPVSDTNRAIVRLSNLDGRPDGARIAALDAADALRSGLSPDDPVIQFQRLETGDQFAHEGRIEAATDLYDDVAKKAAARGDAALEGQALFRTASLLAALADVDPDYGSRARRAAERIERRTDPGFAPARDGLVLLRTKLALSGRTSGARRISALAAMDTITADEAVLLQEPRAERDTLDAYVARNFGGNDAPEWADVAFRILPDGKVGDLAVLKRSESRPGAWLDYQLKVVRGRRYASLKAPLSGVYRVERYSMVYGFGTSIGSRVPSRLPRGRIETTNVTPAYRTASSTD